MTELADRRPVWLLDIDGVVNASEPLWGDEPMHGIAVSNGSRFVMRWSPALVAEINQVAQSGLVEVRWCSTWCDSIESPAQLFGMEGFTAAFTEVSSNVAYDKFYAAEHVLKGERRPLIWTDDDLGWILQTATGSPTFSSELPSLLIQPDPFNGLLAEDMLTVRAFARGVNPPA